MTAGAEDAAPELADDPPEDCPGALEDPSTEDPPADEPPVDDPGADEPAEEVLPPPDDAAPAGVDDPVVDPLLEHAATSMAAATSAAAAAVLRRPRERDTSCLLGVAICGVAGRRARPKWCTYPAPAARAAASCRVAELPGCGCGIRQSCPNIRTRR